MKKLCLFLVVAALAPMGLVGVSMMGVSVRAPLSPASAGRVVTPAESVPVGRQATSLTATSTDSDAPGTGRWMD
jgi:hypothetical protein